MIRRWIAKQRFLSLCVAAFAGFATASWLDGLWPDADPSASPEAIET